jgi:hypothetical protein
MNVLVIVSLYKSVCVNSFKTVGKAFLMKLVEIMPRVGKAVIMANIF